MGEVVYEWNSICNHSARKVAEESVSRDCMSGFAEEMLCSNKLRIAILNEEIGMWEKRLKDDPDQIPYLGYIRTTLKDRVKELEKEEANECQNKT